MARMQGKTTSDDFQCFAGVDISKAHLDLAVSGAGRGVRFSNDAAGIAGVVAHLGGRRHRVVLEPTGRYHVMLWRALSAAGHAVAPVNPYRARQLAEGLGRIAKTDAVDARMLALIAARLPLRALEPPDDMTLDLKALYSARRSLIRRRAAARTQATGAGHAFVRHLLEQEIGFLSEQIAALETRLDALIQAQPERRRIRAILTSVPGIGAGASLAILAELPEIGRAGPGEVSALAGCAPMTRESGQWKGASRTRGGRRSLRAALHMAAVVAMTHNPPLRAFADRLRARGKHGNLVLAAVLRKLIVLANALVAQNRKWSKNAP